MGLFDNIKTTRKPIDLNEQECYLFLPYHFYAKGSLDGLEGNVFMGTMQSFLKVDEVDYDSYFNHFDILLKEYTSEELIDHCLDKIDKRQYLKLFIYLTEGVLADGGLDDDEQKKINYATKLMDIDNEFASKVIDVMIKKYIS